MKNFKVALQLYTVRDEMEKDIDKTLEAVKDMGYDFVECAGYFGKSAKEFRGLLDKHGLETVSAHQGFTFTEEDKEIVEYLRELGVEYGIIPWYEPGELQNNFPETVTKFTRLGQLLKDNGLKLLYHNHEFEFHKINGEYILDKLFASIPQDLLEPQIDTCWVHYAGINPVEYIEKYSDRATVVHLKDFVCKALGGGPIYQLVSKEEIKSREDTGFEFRPLGLGIQDFPAILDAATKAGTEYIVVEQDAFVDITSLEAARVSREYLKKIGS